MKQGWNSVVTYSDEQNATSFIGGKPCIPPSEPLPICKICGEPLTFFFQVAFPEGHVWAGKSLALFFCSSTYHKHDDKEKLPPNISTGINNFNIPANAIDPEHYQTLFRAIVFNTSDGVIREDYHERVRYQKISWVPTKKKDKKIPIVLGGEPIWVGKAQYGKESPATYDGKPMELILQVADFFNFERLPDAPPEYKKSYLGPAQYKPREKDYTLFFEFNRVYLWGTVDCECPVVYVSVQNNI